MRNRNPLASVVGVVVIALTLLAPVACSDDSKSSGSTTTSGGGGTTTIASSKFEDMTAQSAVEIKAEDNTFTPQYVKVKKGTTVTFVNDGRNTHNVLAVKDGAFGPVEADAFGPGASVPVTFDKAGDFPYYCSLHGTPTKGMYGTVRVVE